MAQAKIILTDEGPEIDVSIDFGDAGADDNSSAHHLAVEIARGILSRLRSDDDEDKE